MAQKVELKIDGDPSGLVASVKSAIAQIQKEADKLKISPQASKSVAPGFETLQKTTQTTRDLDSKTRAEKAALTEINRQLAQKETQISKIQKMQESSNKTLEREIQLKNQLARAERELEEKKGIARIQQVRYNTAQVAQQRAMGVNIPGTTGSNGATGGSGTMPLGGITSASGLAKFLGVPAGILGGLATSVALGQGGEGLRKYFAENSNRSTVNEASAFQMQGQGGQRLQSILGGNAAEELTFDPLRAQAAKNAESAMKGRMESSFRVFTRPLQTLSGRANNGYETGNQFGIGTAGMKREIDSEQQKERASLQAEQFEALKNGPEGLMRTAVANRYLQNAQRDLDFQRQTGLNNSSFRGPSGFLSNAQDAGFTDIQGMGMASGILGAGGSTRSATGNATLGLQAQRNLDMTNSGNILGKLSGSMGSADTTKESFVKLLAEGTRVGLDGSDFRQENRKFVETAADIISKSGTTSGAGVDQILSQFGKFFGDKTMTGMEAGKNAFDIYRDTSMATSGPRGTMRAAGMLTDPTISKLSRDSREALFNMPIDQLTPDNPAIIAMAQQAKTSPEALIKAQNGITSNSANLFKNSDMARDNLSKVKSKYGVSSSIGFQGPLSTNAYDEIQGALGQSNIAQIKEHPELGQNQRTASAYSEAISRGDASRQGQALEEAKRQQLSATSTGRPEDETNRLQAEASKLANQLFMSIKDSIIPASDAVKTFANDINNLVTAIKSGTPAGSAINAFNSKYPGIGATTAPSAGAPNSGGGSGR